MISQNEAKPSPFELIFKTAPHIAEEVAKNFDRKFRFNVLKYVSKGFHEAVGRIDKKNYLIKIEGDKNTECIPKGIYNSVLNSCRSFDMIEVNNVKLNDENLNQLSMIAEKHGKTITWMQIKDCQIFWHDLDGISKFLQKFPKLDALWIWYTKSSATNPPANFKMPKLEPILHKIQDFSVNFDKVTVTSKIFKVFSQLIPHDSITTFNFWNLDIFDLTSFVQNQSKINDLELCKVNSNDICDARIFSNLKLEKFVCDKNNWKQGNKFMEQLIHDHHATLKTLGTYCPFEVTKGDSIFKKCQQLRSLFLWISNENCQHLKEIVHLKKLEHFSVGAEENFTQYGVLKEISERKMPTVKGLQLLYIDEINVLVRSLKSFGQNWENVERVKYLGYPIAITNFIDNFPKLKSLTLLEFWPEVNKSNTYPNLKKLKICELNESSLVNILEAFPNLTSLEITCCKKDGKYLKADMIIQSLASHKKLRKLDISFERDSLTLTGSTSDAIDILQRQIPKSKIEFSKVSKAIWVIFPLFAALLRAWLFA